MTFFKTLNSGVFSVFSEKSLKCLHFDHSESDDSKNFYYNNCVQL